MRTLTIVMIFVLGFTSYSFAYDSGIALTTDKGITMQVYVNGKLLKKQPGKIIRVRSSPGLFHVEVKVLNPENKKWYSVRKEIKAQKGFELQYKLVFVGSKPQIIEISKYPIYSRYFLNPTLYNKHSVT